MSNSKFTPLILSKSSPSDAYVGFWPGCQDTTDGRAVIVDKSGNDNDLLLGAQATYAAVTGAAGYASIVGAAATSDKSLATSGVLPWDMFAGQSLILAFVIKAAAPGATATVFNARGASGDVKGVAVVVDTNGKPFIYIRDTATTFATNLPADIVCDGTAHVIVVAIDGTGKMAYGWKNGVAWSTLTSGQAITATTGSTQGNDPLRWGASGDFVSASVGTWVNGATLNLRHMHALVLNSWPANIGDIVEELTKNIHRPLSAKLLP